MSNVIIAGQEIELPDNMIPIQAYLATVEVANKPYNGANVGEKYVAILIEILNFGGKITTETVYIPIKNIPIKNIPSDEEIESDVEKVTILLEWYDYKGKIYISFLNLLSFEFLQIANILMEENICSGVGELEIYKDFYDNDIEWSDIASFKEDVTKKLNELMFDVVWV